MADMLFEGYAHLAAARRGTGGSKSRGQAAASARPGPSAGGRTKAARQMRLDRIRKEIRSGTYETEGKLRIAISRLIDDVLARPRKVRR